MWAGGSLTFHGDIRVGDTTRRLSRVENVVLKEGRTGPLCFVTVAHRVEAAGRLAVEERQDIVYRGIEAAGDGAKALPRADSGVHQRRMQAQPPLLFRYSALTFNGHRIHYDRRHVTEVEGYPGLIVHGPLQAALLVNYATELHGTPPARFSFRGHSPLFDDDVFVLHATPGGRRPEAVDGEGERSGCDGGGGALGMNAALDFIVPLFVPGNRPERFEKAASSGADAVIIDLEDAVAADAKDAARAALSGGFTDRPVLVRINGIGTPWHMADVAAVSGLPFAAMIVPKAEASEDFDALCASSPLPVVALVETARGLAEARRIAAAANVARLAFGSIDFCADLGCAHTREALLSARSELVLASRLAGLTEPIDGVTAAIDDAALVTSDARHARELGFGGKLCIHPRQVAAIRAGFRPDEAEIAWARKVLASGDGAAAVDGAMVDEPVRVRARSILKRAEEGNLASRA